MDDPTTMGIDLGGLRDLRIIKIIRQALTIERDLQEAAGDHLLAQRAIEADKALARIRYAVLKGWPATGRL